MISEGLTIKTNGYAITLFSFIVNTNPQYYRFTVLLSKKNYTSFKTKQNPNPNYTFILTEQIQ